MGYREVAKAGAVILEPIMKMEAITPENMEISLVISTVVEVR
jgi:hypothetical protein